VVFRLEQDLHIPEKECFGKYLVCCSAYYEYPNRGGGVNKFINNCKLYPKSQPQRDQTIFYDAKYNSPLVCGIVSGSEGNFELFQDLKKNLNNLQKNGVNFFNLLIVSELVSLREVEKCSSACYKFKAGEQRVKEVYKINFKSSYGDISLSGISDDANNKLERSYIKKCGEAKCRK